MGGKRVQPLTQSLIIYELMKDRRRFGIGLGAQTLVQEAHDAFPVEATPSSTYPLSTLPLAVIVVAVNGEKLVHGAEWSCDNTTGIVTLDSSVVARLKATPAPADVVSVDYLVTAGLVAQSGAAWVDATTNGTQAAPASTAWVASGFPDSSAYWIWDRTTHTADSTLPAGDCYFRKNLTGTTGAARIYKCSDDNSDVYLNGTLVPITSSISAVHSADVTLTGDDWLAVKGTNLGDEAGVLIAVYALSGGTPTTLLVHTDSTWDCVGYPAAPPSGWPGPW